MGINNKHLEIGRFPMDIKIKYDFVVVEYADDDGFFTPNAELCAEVAEIGAWTPVCETILALMLAGF